MNLYKHIINIILRLGWWCKVFYRGSSTNGQPNTTSNAIGVHLKKVYLIVRDHLVKNIIFKYFNSWMYLIFNCSIIR